MERIRTIQIVIGKSAGSFLSFALCLYLAFHLMHGERGYFALQGVQGKLADARADLGEVRARREKIEHNVELLRPQSLDADLLDERTRIVLGHTRPGEIVVLGAD